MIRIELVVRLVVFLHGVLDRLHIHVLGCVSRALISIGRHLRTPCAPGIFHLHPGFVGLSLATLEL